MAAEPIGHDDDDRSGPRHDVFLRTRITFADGRSMPAILVNLSQGGFMARVSAEAEAGEKTVLTLPIAGDVEAIVRWSLGGRIGAEFVAPIDRATFPALLAATGG